MVAQKQEAVRGLEGDIGGELEGLLAVEAMSSRGALWVVLKVLGGGASPMGGKTSRLLIHLHLYLELRKGVSQLHEVERPLTLCTSTDREFLADLRARPSLPEPSSRRLH